MVFLINLLPLLIFAIACFIAYRFKKWWVVLVGAVIVYFYMQAQPSYGVKGVVERTALPDFEQSSKEMVDRLSKPKSGKDYDKQRKAEFESIDNKLKEWNQKSDFSKQ